MQPDETVENTITLTASSTQPELAAKMVNVPESKEITLAQKADTDAVLEAVKELTKVVGELKKEITDLITENKRWFKAQRGF